MCGKVLAVNDELNQPSLGPNVISPFIARPQNPMQIRSSLHHADIQPIARRSSGSAYAIE
jgi:hypothetical protein